MRHAEDVLACLDYNMNNSSCSCAVGSKQETHNRVSPKENRGRSLPVKANLPVQGKPKREQGAFAASQGQPTCAG